MHNTDIIDRVTWNAAGLVPAIAQDVHTEQVLMLAWMNRESLIATLQSGEAVYWSRSRDVLWHKGATSGCTQTLHEIRLDCDGDTLLLLVEQQGAGACHTGAKNCFFTSLYQKIPKDTDNIKTNQVLEKLTETLQSRKHADPTQSYTAKLYRDGLDAILQKVGEEAIETLLAAKSGSPEQLINESADLWFHTLLMLVHCNLSHEDLLHTLRQRMGRSGHDEKAARPAT